jgi:single-stranded-DNA-specific exonuclease
MQGSTAQIEAKSHWVLSTQHVGASELANRLKISTLLAQSLLSRGLEGDEECRAFLQPNLKMLHDPSTLPGIGPAAERIARAIRERQKVVIYGDYDVDGITASAILWHAIRLLDGDVSYYVPHRIEEGYGLNPQAVGQLIDGGAQLIVTVDCGVTAIEAAKVARERGADLIITDHHHFDPAGLPDCCGIVHPRLPGEGAPYANPNLCGAGVAFKLAWQIGRAVCGNTKVSDAFRAFLLDATALAALGTIADVVPLVGENRVLAHYGLSGLRESKLTGIGALIESAALTGKQLDSYHVGFCLAPRLNACGRMGHANLAVKMLTEATPAEAIEIANYLEEQNRARQAMERSILDEALVQLNASDAAMLSERAVVLASDKWHPGVIGIVAARLVDRYCRPTVMISLANSHGQGSGRSIPGFSLAEALNACSEHLIAHGGHEMAAGLKIEPDKFETFRRAFCDYAGKHVGTEMMRAQLSLEAPAMLGQMTEALVADLARLGPFGHGNRRPIWWFKNVTLAYDPRVVGKTGQHLQLSIRQGEHRMKCIAFGFVELAERLHAGDVLELAAEPMINEFNGRRSVELEVKDLRMGCPS